MSTNWNLVVFNKNVVDMDIATFCKQKIYMPSFFELNPLLTQFFSMYIITSLILKLYWLVTI
jgi:hypothetical protein